MPDVFTPAKRSDVMSRIRSRNTKPELAVRSILHRAGLRFTVNGPKNRSLPGKPDIVLPKHRTVVFVHGCFWHGHPGCKLFRMPKSRTEFWTAKIEGNRARDARAQRALELMGWRVILVWQCSLGGQTGSTSVAAALTSSLGVQRNDQNSSQQHDI
jgi:DNA mismatch endonuclease (patch repair protein)